ncbi:MAG: class I SAM-dependent methyltransferase [Myxococcota bacterium]
MLVDRGTVAGNVYDKYGTKNPFARLLVSRFMAAVRGLFDAHPDERVVEIGCGEGELLPRLLAGRAVRVALGTDVSPRVAAEAARRTPALSFAAQSAYALALRDHSAEVVVACEVLEHLERPDDALREIARVARRRVILSVPREPLWRVLNVARGRYLGELGNTPGHVQHFSRAAFCALVERHLRIVEVRAPLPWIIVAAEPF